MSRLFGRRRRPARDDALAPVKDSVLLRPLMLVVGALARPVAALGADAQQFRAVVEAKLRIDLRQGGIKNPNRPGRGGLLLTCIGYALGGTWVGVMAFVESRAFTYMAMVQVVSMVLLAVTLVTDFLSLVMDPADLSVLAPRPLSDRTLLLARVVHVGLYLGLVLGSLVLGPLVMGCIVFGPLAWIPAMALAMPLAGLFTLMMILAVFLSVLRLVGPERVRTFMLVVQMLLSLGIFAGWQSMAIAVRESERLAWFRAEDAGKALLPPYWFGGLAALFVDGPTPLRATLAGLALALPPLLAAAVLQLASARRLSAMAALAGAEPDARRAGRPGRLRRLGVLLARPGPERAGFDMFLTVARHDRLFRMRVYPMLVIPLVFLAFIGFVDADGAAGEHVSLAALAAFLPAIYSIMILAQTRYSESPRAAWIFATAPVEQLGLFASGVVRALCFCFLLPWLLLVLGLTAVLSGRAPLLDAVFAALAVVTATFVLAGLFARKTLPFSQEMSTMDGASNIISLMLGSALLGLLFGCYVLLRHRPPLLVAATLALVPLCWLSAQRLRHLRVPCPGPDFD